MSENSNNMGDIKINDTEIKPKAVEPEIKLDEPSDASKMATLDEPVCDTIVNTIIDLVKRFKAYIP